MPLVMFRMAFMFMMPMVVMVPMMVVAIAIPIGLDYRGNIFKSPGGLTEILPIIINIPDSCNS